MKIGILKYTYFPTLGGAEICTHALATIFSEMGHEVTVVSHPRFVNKGVFGGLKNYRQIACLFPKKLWVHFPATWLRCARRAVRQQLGECRFDVVQTVMAWPWLPVIDDIRAVTGARFFLRSVGEDIQIEKTLGYGIRRNRGVRILMDPVFAKADGLIAITPTVRTDYAALGAALDKISIRLFSL